MSQIYESFSVFQLFFTAFLESRKMTGTIVIVIPSEKEDLYVFAMSEEKASLSFFELICDQIVLVTYLVT